MVQPPNSQLPPPIGQRRRTVGLLVLSRKPPQTVRHGTASRHRQWQRHSQERSATALTRSAMCDNCTTPSAIEMPVGTLFNIIATELTRVLNVYFTPVLVILGTFGNLASVFVFYTSKLRLQSTSQYLSALAISDTAFLLELIPPWLNTVQLTGIFNEHGFCQIFVYISYVTSCVSAWLVVAFTVERFVAVAYPLQRNAVCTISRARYIIAFVVVAALLVNLPVLQFAVPTANDCSVDYEFLVYAERFNIVDTIVNFTVPMVLIIILNTWIVIVIYKLGKTRKQLMRADRQAAREHRVRQPRMFTYPLSQQRVTRMLLIVSSVYVVLNLPAYVMRILAYAYLQSSVKYQHWGTWQQIATTFFNTNYGINFILYCMTGQNFRRALHQAVPWLRQHRRNNAMRNDDAYANVGQCRANSISTDYASNCTEATHAANCPAFIPLPPPPPRRRHEEQFITRWTFDNRRRRAQQQQPVNIEMGVLAYRDNM